MRSSLAVLGLLAGLLLMAPPAHAVPIHFTTILTGANENPANASPGTGSADVALDLTAHTMQVDVTFSGLIAGVTAAHIHCCAAPPANVGVATTVPTFPGFPSGVTAGTYSHLFDLTDVGTYNPSFVTGHGGTLASAEAALLDGIFQGHAYLNIHTTSFPGGEIRGFLPATAAVPLPGTLVLLILGGAGIFVAGHRRRA